MQARYEFCAPLQFFGSRVMFVLICTCLFVWEFIYVLQVLTVSLNRITVIIILKVSGDMLGINSLFSMLIF